MEDWVLTKYHSSKCIVNHHRIQVLCVKNLFGDLSAWGDFSAVFRCLNIRAVDGQGMLQVI